MWYSKEDFTVHISDMNYFGVLRTLITRHSISTGAPVFCHSTCGTLIKPEGYEEFIKYIESKNFKLFFKNVNSECLYTSPNGFIYINEDFSRSRSPFPSPVTATSFKASPVIEAINVTHYSLDSLELQTILDFAEHRLTKVEPIGKVKILISGVGGLHIETLGEIKCPFDPGNYTKFVQDQFNTIVKEFKEPSPSGRLVILHGPPGTGKSFFIRSLISCVPSTFIYIPAVTVGSISGPEVIGTILEYEEDKKQPIVLIIEDADSSLIKREHGNPNNLSEILNISDGLLGELVNIRILATTNQEKLDIDSAALRPGRLCASVQFDPMTPEHAGTVYKTLTNTDFKFKAETTLAEVYSKAKNPEFKEHQKKKKESFGTYA